MPKTKRTRTPVPAPATVDPVIDLSKYEALNQLPEQVLKGNAQAAYLDIEGPAYARSNAGAAGMARQAADDQKLPTAEFPAFQLKIDADSKTVLAIPVKEFDPNQKDLYQVHWNSKHSMFSIDLAYGLIPVGWGTPDEMIRRVKVTLLRNLPDIGSALMLHLKGSKLRNAKGSENQSGEAPAQT